MNYSMGWHGWGGIGMAIFWLIVIVLVVAAVKYLSSGTSRRGTGPGGLDKTALDLLEETYARGEISRDEFLQKRADLQRQ